MHLIVEDRVDDVRKKYFDQTGQSILTSDMFDNLV